MHRTYTVHFTRLIYSALIVVFFVPGGPSVPVTAGEQQPWVVYEGEDGPGSGSHVVLIAGDEEYRSEEALPQLGKILAERHGFRCTVLFPIDPKTGRIKPDFNRNIPGTSALSSADLMVIFTRFRSLPYEQMKPIDAYLKRGGPVIGIRPTVVGFRYGADSPWAHYSDGYDGPKEAWKDGFGEVVLGETWISHHGDHGSESTRGVVPKQALEHPITNGVGRRSIWGPTDVYEVYPPDRATILLRGRVLAGMSPDSEPNPSKNDPMMPLAWLNPYRHPTGKQGTCFTTTIGAAGDFQNEALRRLFVNATYFLLEKDVPQAANVETVGDYQPGEFGFGDYKKKRTPSFYRRKK